MSESGGGRPLSGKPILVLGATSLVGRYLLPRLVAAGRTVEAVSRRPPAVADAHARWLQLDIDREGDRLPAAATAVHLAPLWLAPPLVFGMAGRGLRRLIAFGSTSRRTKAGSADARERELAARLARAEDDLRLACDRSGVAWTLFRPTMIYGGALDKNLTAIARFARRLGFVAIAGRGGGLRHPVHADDLAGACLQALASPATHGRVYEVGGGTVLSYRDMVAEVCRAAGGARLVSVPAPLLRFAFRAAAVVPRYRGLSASIVDRMDQDLVADDAAARRDLGYRPRAFAYPDGGPVPSA